MRFVCGLAAFALGVGGAVAADHPVAGDMLRLRDPVNDGSRRIRFRSGEDAAIDPATAPDPRTAGATLEIVGRAPGDGTSGVLTLDPGSWVALGNPPGSRGYRWVDRTRAQGVKLVSFKPGRLSISGGGRGWAYELTQPQGPPIDVRFQVGSELYCARFTNFRTSRARKLTAQAAAPPPDCSIPPAPECGNGLAEGAEECDDGNNTAGDGCAPSCALESVDPALCAGIPSVAGTGLTVALVASGLEAPVHVAAPRLDPHRLFIVEQPGRIRLVKNGVLQLTPFLAIGDRTRYASGTEEGLLSVAFHPDYEQNGRFFVYYVENFGNLVIARYQVSGDPDVADAASEHVIQTITHQPYQNHNGGNLVFGPDGFLYAGTGDGGFFADPNEAAQNDQSLLGKLLRIDPATDSVAVWAKGLRNPWRFSFDRATGDLYVADVGQDNWEEVNVVPAPVTSGVNYGWDFFEGRHCFADTPPGPPCPDPASFTSPVLEYCHFGTINPDCGDHPTGCSISGGFVYRGCRLTELQGTYFYSDICVPFIRTFRGVSGGNAQNPADRTAELAPGGNLDIDGVSSFGEDARGELYIVDYADGARGGGEVYRIEPIGSSSE